MLVGEEKEVFMPDFAGALGASKAASALLVLLSRAMIAATSRSTSGIG